MAAFVKSLHRLYSQSSLSMTTSPVTTVRLVSRSFSPPSFRSLQTSAAAPTPASHKQLRRPSSLTPESSESDDDDYANPWLKSGRLHPCVYIEEDEVVKTKADLPGIGREDIKLWIENSMIHFEAVEKKKKNDDGVAVAGEDAAADEDEPRTYSGVIGVPDGGYNLEKATAEMKNGVLEVVIPRIPLEERKDVKFISVV